MVRNCLKCEELIPKVIDKTISLIPKRYHYNGLCVSCHNIEKENPERREYWEYRWIIEISKNNSGLKGFPEWQKERYNKFKENFGELRILYN